VIRQAAFDRSERGIGAPSVRPAAFEIRAAAAALAAKLGDAGPDQIDRGLAGVGARRLRW
jgi:hypothetical protein